MLLVGIRESLEDYLDKVGVTGSNLVFVPFIYTSALLTFKTGAVYLKSNKRGIPLRSAPLIALAKVALLLFNKQLFIDHVLMFIQDHDAIDTRR